MIKESVCSADATSFERVSPLRPAGGSLSSRKDTMTLSTMPKKPTVISGTVRRETDFSLQTRDILGAFVSPRWDRFVQNRPPPEEVEGSTSLSHYPPIRLRPQNLSLTTADIEYCLPRRRDEMVTPRQVNPLEPKYSFSASEAEAPPAPPFSGRQTNYIGDIEFTSPKPRIPLDKPARDSMKPTIPNAPKYGRGGVSASLFAKDVNFPNGEPRKRKLEGHPPLEPLYRVPVVPACTSVAHTWEEERRTTLRTPAAEVITIGEVPGGKPGKCGIRDNGEAQLSLFAADLAGAAPQRYVGHCPWSLKGKSNGKPRFYDPWDIPGAQADSITHGPNRKR